MRYWTFNGTRLFRKPETAAKHAVKNHLDASSLQILFAGQLVPPEDWEVRELELYMKHYE